MRIAIPHFHHYIFGGPDRYFFNVKAALEEGGHEVIPFSFHNDRNFATPYSKYFVRPVDGQGAALLKDAKLGPSQKAMMAMRMFWNPELFRNFRRMLREEKPDLVFTVYLSWTILPRILKIAKREFGLPVLYRLSDFHLICPSYMFYREGKPCTECAENLSACVKHRCMHGSKLGSMLRTWQMTMNRTMKYYDCVDRFICPTAFMAEWIEKAGIPRDKTIVLPTFSKDLLQGSEPAGSDAVTGKSQPYILFFGRVVPEKGPEVLVEAYNQLQRCDHKLVFAGDVDPEYEQQLRSLLRGDVNDRVTFLGQQSGDELNSLIRHAAFVVHPAIWYENMPNAILEAFSAGKAVIASNLGSLPHLVAHEKNGLLFEPGSATALSDALTRVIDDPSLRERLGQGARTTFEKYHMKDTHIDRLMALFEEYSLTTA